jgi:hypothetical protein
MASYLLDIIYARNIFAGMNLSWHIEKLHVHVYFSILWENRYKILCAMICDGFISRIYLITFRKECLRILVAAKYIITKVGHWYFEETSTYIRMFKATSAPHLLPVHVPDRLILGEICYHTILQGYNASLVKNNKRSFILYGFHIGFYMVKDTT